MGELIRFINGRAYKQTELLKNGKYKVLRVGNFFTNSSWYYSDLELEEDKYCTNGDLLYAWSASFGARIWEGGKTIFHYHIWKLDFNETILDKEFLFYFLEYDKNQIKESTTGSTMVHVSMEHMVCRSLYIPPLNEQKRIVDQLKKILSIVDLIEKGQFELSTSIDVFKSYVLSLAISGKLIPQDPTDEPAIELLRRINPGFKPCDNSHYGDLPIGWSICTLYDICDTINGLWKGKNPPFVNVGVIRNANFTKDFNLDYSKIEYIDVEQRAFEKRNLEDGDLIVEKSGGSDNFPVGRSILYQGESSKYSFSNFTMALRIKDKNLICSKYLYFVILHKYLSGEMTQMQTQTTGLHNLLSDKYMSMPIPMPPTKEQDRIVDCIEKLLGQANQIKTVL